MCTLHHKLVLFQQSGNCFCYVPENDIEGDILGWTTSMGGPHPTTFNKIPVWWNVNHQYKWEHTNSTHMLYAYLNKHTYTSYEWILVFTGNNEQCIQDLLKVTSSTFNLHIIIVNYEDYITQL